MVLLVAGLKVRGECPLELDWLKGERTVEAYGDNGGLVAAEGL
jgi:hypothetical protein